MELKSHPRYSNARVPCNDLSATLIEDDVAYVVAKEVMNAVDITTGQIQWESAKIKGLITETQIARDKLVADWVVILRETRGDKEL